MTKEERKEMIVGTANLRDSVRFLGSFHANRHSQGQTVRSSCLGPRSTSLFLEKPAQQRHGIEHSITTSSS